MSEMQRTGSKWLTARICVYADRVLGKPDLQPLREDIIKWADCKARVSYTDVTSARDFISFDLNLMTECDRNNKISDAQYMDRICAIIPEMIEEFVGPDYKGYTEVFIRVGNHLCARLG